MIGNVTGKSVNIPDNHGLNQSFIDATKVEKFQEFCSVCELGRLSLFDESFEDLDFFGTRKFLAGNSLRFKTCPASVGNGRKGSAVKITERTNEEATQEL